MNCTPEIRRYMPKLDEKNEGYLVSASAVLTPVELEECIRTAAAWMPRLPPLNCRPRYTGYSIPTEAAKRVMAILSNTSIRALNIVGSMFSTQPTSISASFCSSSRMKDGTFQSVVFSGNKGGKKGSYRHVPLGSKMGHFKSGKASMQSYSKSGRVSLNIS